MQIIQVAINDLKEADYNPRKMTEKQVADLTASLKQFGFVEPIIVNKSPERLNVVVGGHQRLKVARMMGMTEVPVFYVELPLETEKKLNLRLNRNNGDWDWDILANQFDQSTLIEIGFDKTDFNIFPEKGEPKPSNIRPGDVFLLASHRLVVGNADSFEGIVAILDKWKKATKLNPIRESDGVTWSVIKS